MSTYHDGPLTQRMKELREATKPLPKAAKALAQLEDRLQYLDTVLHAWDTHHAALARQALEAGRYETGQLTAYMVFDPARRQVLLTEVTMYAPREIDHQADAR